MIQWPKPVWEATQGVREILIFDEKKCTGCMMCQALCPVNRYEALSDKYGVISRPPILFETKDDAVAFHRICGQCTNAPCRHICPAKVITRDEKTGAIQVEKEHCLGCGFCVVACPNDAIFLDLGRGKAIKCELCGGHPECVANCPSGALRLLSGR